MRVLTYMYLKKNVLLKLLGMRDNSDVIQEVLILTDGRSNCDNGARAAALGLHSTATVYGLVIGDLTTAGQTELTSYVSTPPSNHLFAVKDFNELKNLVDAVGSQLSTNVPCFPFDLSDG